MHGEKPSCLEQRQGWIFYFTYCFLHFKKFHSFLCKAVSNIPMSWWLEWAKSIDRNWNCAEIRELSQRMTKNPGERGGEGHSLAGIDYGMEGWEKGNGQPNNEPCCAGKLGLNGQIHTGQCNDIRQAVPEGDQPMELIWRDDKECKPRWGMMKGKSSAAKRNWWQNKHATVPSGSD